MSDGIDSIRIARDTRWKLQYFKIILSHSDSQLKSTDAINK